MFGDRNMKQAVRRLDPHFCCPETADQLRYPVEAFFKIGFPDVSSVQNSCGKHFILREAMRFQLFEILSFVMDEIKPDSFDRKGDQLLVSIN